ncbi:hypothetical protein [Tenacibaculum amylolyticum]|uniref:hypothetical protein n=1 Tax=Tenacibaculum amylolyticum TaxID=104269 RepID=UPI0038941690
MNLESLDKFEVINQDELDIIQGGFAAASTVESERDDSDVESGKKDGNAVIK